MKNKEKYEECVLTFVCDGSSFGVYEKNWWNGKMHGDALHGMPVLREERNLQHKQT